MSTGAAATLGRLTREYSGAGAAADARAEQVEASVASSWDREQFAEYQRESDLIASTDYLSAWLDTEAVLSALAGVVRALSVAELRILTEWAKAVGAVELRIPESRLAVPTLRSMIDSYAVLRSGVAT